MPNPSTFVRKKALSGSGCVPLAEYFVVVGYTSTSRRGESASGRIIQRFPTKDWEDFPFKDNIEDFCQPTGWNLSSEAQEPKFFPFVLSDHMGNRQYCGCLAFYEPISVSQAELEDEDEDVDVPCGSNGQSESYCKSGLTRHLVMYAPKSLVIISRLPHTEAFRNCLGAIYTAHIEQKDVQLETLVGNLLGHVNVPPCGGRQLRFSIGCGDWQMIQPPASSKIPITNFYVADIFYMLGINNVLFLFCAVMTEHKIILHSNSIVRLYEACHALKSLMYPFEFTHTYVPHLPASTLDVCESPTPFIYGVHSSLRSEISGLVDVIIADLDGGSLVIPDGIVVPNLPEVVTMPLKDQLSDILHPEILSADLAFPPLALKPSVPFELDKQIRALFIRLFAVLFHGYRECLVIIRIHPKPVIKLHKGRFLNMKGFVNDEFMNRVLDCMFFGEFLRERGPPWRTCDIWDDVIASLPDKAEAERNDTKMTFTHIKEIARMLEQNEIPSPQNYTQKLLKPPDGSHLRVHVVPFPTLDGDLVEDVMQRDVPENSSRSPYCAQKQNLPRFIGTSTKSLRLFETSPGLMDNSVRRLEVLRECISSIFDGKISDARKSIHAVFRSLQSLSAKLTLCEELKKHVTGNKAMLDSQQFDMVVKLMQCTLQGVSKMDEGEIAAAILPLAASFCRKLCTGVIQFAFTSIQDHPVWQNQQFWESAFYSDAQREIKALYLPKDGTNISGSHSSALDIAAEQLKMNLSKELRNEYSVHEESTIYSQLIHYANRMVYLLVPLDISSKRKKIHTYADEERSSNLTSVAESDSMDASSAKVDERDSAEECRVNVIRFVNKFVDHISNECSILPTHKEALEHMIPGVVDMHFETLDSVCRESRRLPKLPKPKIPSPNLLTGEKLMAEGIRSYLLPDGREDPSLGIGPALLPAEGVLFVTNYRVVFKGTPCDPFANDSVTIRSFPIASLTKEKRITIDREVQLGQTLLEGIQLRSATFQLMRIAFDEDVSSESIEMFRKTLHRLRHPHTITSYFSFVEEAVISPQLLTHKDKSNSLRGFAKKTFMRTAKKVGIKGKYSEKQKYGDGVPWGNGTLLNRNGTLERPGHEIQDDDGSENGSQGQGYNIEENTQPQGPFSGIDSKLLGTALLRSYYKDYRRLGLGNLLNSSSISSTSQDLSSMKISAANLTYSLCDSYPALLVVPAAISDDHLKKVARCYRGNRLPVIVWKHPKFATLLIRGAAFSNKRMMSMLRPNTHNTGAGANDQTTNHTEQHDLYIHGMCMCAPSTRGTKRDSLSDILHHVPKDRWYRFSQISSGRSSMHRNDVSQSVTLKKSPLTPELVRKSASTKLAKAFNFNTLKNNKTYKNLMGTKTRGIHHAENTLSMTTPSQAGDDEVFVDMQNNSGSVTPSLFVFGKKSQVKGIKAHVNGEVAYVPVELQDISEMRTSFKQLMRACVPSQSLRSEGEGGFLKAVENTGWLQQISNLLGLVQNIIDVIEVRRASSMICLEDGWDLTAQVSSLSQLCMDPYYRTFDGFRTLLEKEWLGFGHRFTRRNNLTGLDGPSTTSTFTPVFLQFLDAVHQLMRQYPSAFEFNLAFLESIAYHSASARFRTFLINNELEQTRLEMLGDSGSRYAKARDDISINQNSKNSPHAIGKSMFDYLVEHNKRIPSFYNFCFQKGCVQKSLQPATLKNNLEIWGYYLTETLGAAPLYDLEVFSLDIEDEHAFSPRDDRKLVLREVDDINSTIPDAFLHYFNEIYRIKNDDEMPIEDWKHLWEDIDYRTDVNAE